MEQGKKELQAGDYAPDFTLDTDTSGSVTLSKLRGKNIVLYFYPKDDTPGCTLEAKDFSTNHGRITAAGAVVLGISKDDVESHNKFKDKYCLPFTLASDTEGSVCEAYDVWVEKNMYGKKYMGIQRDTFLIDRDGIIRKIWHKVKVEGHVDEVLAELNKLD
jgi:thioredoxin-dependent peroxiredoxin